MTSMPPTPPEVTVGVDTHRDTHAAAAVDQTGRMLGTASFPVSTRGYVALVTWAERLGPVVKVGIEGTGTYGAGLTRLVHDDGLEVVEVDRPDRKLRRRLGKSDPIDAEAAARATLAGTAATTPKTRQGRVEMIRVLRVARRSALQARVMAGAQLHSLVTSAPEEVRVPLRRLTTTRQLARACVGLRPGALNDPTAATKHALRVIARRWHQLQAELDALDVELETLIAKVAPKLLTLPGVGVDTAGQLLVTAGDNPERLRSEAAFAALAGTNPIPASSGRTDRHRLM